ncbi:hypothetical protein L1887_29312 [Cichorium endivia]|nr:hypothetical protein L1887_29312 [Cichorium endivia]
MPHFVFKHNEIVMVGPYVYVNILKNQPKIERNIAAQYYNHQIMIIRLQTDLPKKQVRALGKFFSFSFVWGFFHWFVTSGVGMQNNLNHFLGNNDIMNPPKKDFKASCYLFFMDWFDHDQERTYHFFHWKKGMPFADDQGIYNMLSWSEQINSGKQLTRNRKFLTIMSVVLADSG